MHPRNSIKILKIPLLPARDCQQPPTLAARCCVLAAEGGTAIVGSCLKTGQQSIFVIIRKIKRIIYVCWIPYLLKIL